MSIPHPLVALSLEPVSTSRFSHSRSREPSWFLELAAPRTASVARCPGSALPTRYSPGLGAQEKEGEPARGVKPKPIRLCPCLVHFQDRRGPASCDAESRGRRGKTRDHGRARCDLAAAGREALEVSSRAVPSREATLPRSRCSPDSRDPGPQAAAQRREECGAESLLGARAPPGARNPPPAPVRCGRKLSLCGTWGPTGLRVSRAAVRAGPTQPGPEGVRSQCHPRATPHVAAAPPGRECVRGRWGGGS